MILDNDLKKVIGYKVGKFSGEDLTHEDFLRVDELSLNNRSFSGESKNINLLGLGVLKNLRSLDLQYFNIDDDIVSLINSFGNLRTLRLISCKCLGERQLNNKALLSLVLNCCDIKDYERIVVPQILTIIGDENLKFDRLQGIESSRIINLQNSKVGGFKKILTCENLEKLSLDGSKIDDENVLSMLRKEIKVSKEDKYLPVR